MYLLIEPGVRLMTAPNTLLLIGPNYDYSGLTSIKALVGNRLCRVATGGRQLIARAGNRKAKLTRGK